MSRENKTIKCAKCKVALEVWTEPDGQMMARCPQCGVSDNLDNVQREAVEFLTEEAEKLMFKPFEDLARTSKNFTFTPSSTQHRSYRFVVDVDFG